MYVYCIEIYIYCLYSTIYSTAPYVRYWYRHTVCGMRLPITCLTPRKCSVLNASFVFHLRDFFREVHRRKTKPACM